MHFATEVLSPLKRDILKLVSLSLQRNWKYIANLSVFVISVEWASPMLCIREVCGISESYHHLLRTRQFQWACGDRIQTQLLSFVILQPSIVQGVAPVVV